MVDGVVEAIKRDVVGKKLVSEEEMDDKDNMLFHLALRNRRNNQNVNAGRFHVLKGADWEIFIEWDNAWNRSALDGKKILRIKGQLGYLESLWSGPALKAS